MSCGYQKDNPLCLLELGAPRATPLWTHAPFCRGEAITAAGMLVGRITPLLATRLDRGIGLCGALKGWDPWH